MNTCRHGSHFPDRCPACREEREERNDYPCSACHLLRTTIEGGLCDQCLKSKLIKGRPDPRSVILPKVCGITVIPEEETATLVNGELF